MTAPAHDLAPWISAVTAAADPTAAWRAAEALLTAASTRRDAAVAVLEHLRHFDHDDRVAAAKRLDALWKEDDEVLVALADAFEQLTDIDDLNAAPPSDPWFRDVVTRVSSRVRTETDPERRGSWLAVLATAARRLGRSTDPLAEDAYQGLLQVRGERGNTHYNYGLFLKTRGRFAEGRRANERARALGLTTQPTLWNLGICATGAGDGAAALAVWKELGHHVELGRFGLPDGRFPSAKVRLAQRPLAERTAEEDSPGLEENIWVERLSACHGIVRCTLFEEDIGVEYGDVILFDGAPVGRQSDGTPIFPHLATLIRAEYRAYWFGGVQTTAGAIAELSRDLPGDAVFYVLTEQVQMLCDSCSKGRTRVGPGHSHTPSQEHRLVRGKICAPPTLSPRELLGCVDRAVQSAPGTRVLSPWLAEEAGDPQRAETEDRELDALFG